MDLLILFKVKETCDFPPTLSVLLVLPEDPGAAAVGPVESTLIFVEAFMLPPELLLRLPFFGLVFRIFPVLCTYPVRTVDIASTPPVRDVGALMRFVRLA